MLEKGFPILSLVLTLTGLWPGVALSADNPPPAKTTETAKKSDEKKKDDKAAPLKEFVLYSIRHQGRWVLARTLPSGLCKAYLSQRPGEGWLAFPPSRPQGNDFLATASPDGGRLAFYSSRGGAVNLWTCLADGGQAEALTDEDLDIADPGAVREGSVAFSPDGKTLAFLKSGDLWVVEMAPRRLRSLTEGQGVKGFAWSPSGKWIAYTQLNSLRKVSVTGYPTEDLASGSGLEPSISWLPDVKREELLYFSRGVAKLDVSKKSDLLFPSAYIPNRVQVAPGKADTYLALGPMPDGTAEVFIGPLSKKEKAARVTQGGVQTAFYSSDGKAIYFVREGRLWRCGTSGAETRILTKVPVLLPGLGLLAVELAAECR